MVSPIRIAQKIYHQGQDYLTSRYYESEVDNITGEDIVLSAIEFTNKLRVSEFEYFFSPSSKKVRLYNSLYVLMLQGLGKYEIENKNGWKDHLDKYQDEDGLWRDGNSPSVWWKNRSSEWNDIHIVPHIIYAYESIGCLPRRRFSFLDKFIDKEVVKDFLNSEINYLQYWESSNGLMNYLVSLIYARDYLYEMGRKDAIQTILDFLNNRSSETKGLWTSSPENRSSMYDAVRGGYHVWMLMIREGIAIPSSYEKNIIDHILLLQNRYGGFNDRVIASTCDNIDCIDPLVRFSIRNPEYRKSEIKDCLIKAKKYLLGNRNSDGGFCFQRNKKLYYGSADAQSNKNESNLFATWFSVLALLIIEEYLTENKYLISNLPGYHYRLK